MGDLELRSLLARTPWKLVGLLVAPVGCPGALDDPARFADASNLEEAAPTESDDAAEHADADVVETSAPPTDGATCPDVPNDVFALRCTSAGCHNSHDKTQGLDLQSPDVASRLVGVSATEGPGLLISATTPSASVLYTKVTPTPPFGARMPLGAALDTTTVACVLAWIQQTTSDAQIPEGGSP